MVLCLPPPTLCLRSARATPLEYAVTKNASASPLECAVPKSLDLKPPEMNSYKKWGVPPFLSQSSFVNRCSSVFICGYTFCLTKIQFRAGFGYNLRRTWEQRHESSQRISDGANQAEARIPEHHAECEICSRKKRHPRRPGAGQHAALERGGVRQ